TSCSGLVEKVQVQSSPLRRLEEWGRTPSRERPTVARAYDHAVDDVLDHRLDVAGELSECAAREAATARLVPREAGFVNDDGVHPRAREVDRAYRACRSCADDEDVRLLHHAIVVAGMGWNPRAVATPHGDARVHIQRATP